MPGWDACAGSPRPGEGTRRLPDGSWVICNRAGDTVRVLARDVPALIEAVTAGSTTIHVTTVPPR